MSSSPRLLARLSPPQFLLLAACATLASAAGADVTVTADLAGTTTLATKFMLDCVGASHGEMYMWEDNRNHLRAIARDIGFAHVRGHGLLDDDLSTYLNGRANMWNLHSIFDFLLSINVRPIFELSFTPSELASDPSDSLMHYRANASPAKDRNASAGHAWFDFIHDLVQDLVDRYGVEEVRRWRFEHYNEPNCGFFKGSTEQWYEQYAAASAAIKSVDALIQVGGPATCALGWLGSETDGNNFMTTVKARGIATDIVTTHLYPTDDIVRNAGGGRDGFSKVIKQAAANVTSFGYPGMPLVMTEFNAGLGLPTEVNGDTPYTAAMVLHNHLALQGVANLETLSFWSYSDLFEEGGMDSQPWHVRRRVAPRLLSPRSLAGALAMLSPPRPCASTHLSPPAEWLWHHERERRAEAHLQVLPDAACSAGGVCARDGAGCGRPGRHRAARRQRVGRNRGRRRGRRRLDAPAHPRDGAAEQL